jgi:hypothetical protein
MARCVIRATCSGRILCTPDNRFAAPLPPATAQAETLQRDRPSPLVASELGTPRSSASEDGCGIGATDQGIGISYVSGLRLLSAKSGSASQICDTSYCQQSLGGRTAHCGNKLEVRTEQSSFRELRAAAKTAQRKPNEIDPTANREIGGPKPEVPTPAPVAASSANTLRRNSALDSEGLLSEFSF